MKRAPWLLMLAVFLGSTPPGSAASEAEHRSASDRASTLAQYQAAEALARAHLASFETLDFEVISKQNWDRLGESHARGVVVHWPDGRQSTGLEAHVQDLKRMFVYAPDARIKEHVAEIASGEWTSVIGVTEGTFTAPMPTASGTPIPPTGKAFRLVISTVGHWKDGVMDEEYLFWDTQSFLKQVGLAR